MQKKIIIANWKMNKLISEVDAFVQTLAAEHDLLAEEVELYLAPAFTMLPAVCSAVSNMPKNVPLKVLAQNVHHHLKGAHTGEVSSLMLRELGVAGTLIGHSERRIACGEDDETINAKLHTCLQQELTPVLCVGETAAQRSNYRAVLQRQMTAGLQGIDVSKVMIAYEPVWAIGSGKTASDEQIQAVHAYLHSITEAKTCILYGGSVTAENAHALLSIAGVDGVLVGGASLDASSLLSICRPRS